MALIVASTSVVIILSCLFRSTHKKEPPSTNQDVKKRPESSSYSTVAVVFMYVLGTLLNQGISSQHL